MINEALDSLLSCYYF